MNTSLPNWSWWETLRRYKVRILLRHVPSCITMYSFSDDFYSWYIFFIRCNRCFSWKKQAENGTDYTFPELHNHKCITIIDNLGNRMSKSILYIKLVFSCTVSFRYQQGKKTTYFRSPKPSSPNCGLNLGIHPFVLGTAIRLGKFFGVLQRT